MLSLPLRFWIFFVLVVAGAAFMGIAGGIFVSNLKPPIKILAQEDAGRLLQNADRIVIRYTIDKVRNCPLSTSHFLVTDLDVDGKKIPLYWEVNQGDGPVPYEDLGVADYLRSLPKPNVFPGDWKFITKTESYCGPLGWLFPQVTQTEPLPIDIERIRAIPGVNVTSQAKKDGPKRVISGSPLLPGAPFVTMPPPAHRP